MRESVMILIGGGFFILPLLWARTHAEENKTTPVPQPQSAVLERFSPAQREKLLAGEAVYELVEEKNAAGESQGHGQASILIKAPIETCWKIFCEFDKHHLYFPRKTKSEVIKREGNTAWVHKEFNFYVATIQYTVLYTLDPDNFRLEFQLDPAYPHDLKDSAGFFHFEKYTANQTLLTYAATRVETNVKIPKFIQEYLASHDLPGVVVNIKKRIESGGTWTKAE